MLFEFGRLFLDAYNAKNGTDFTPERFFREVYWPLFLNADKHLSFVTNSPFVQGKKKRESDARRLERLAMFENDIRTKPLHAGTAPGFPALSETSSTSGQVSNVPGIPAGTDFAYLSWIALGLGVCLEGGICVLFYDADILLRIAEGWERYREYVDTHDTEGRQIATWNAYTLLDEEPGKLKNEKIATLPWPRLVLKLAKEYPNCDQLMGYGYSFSQTNVTFGWMPFFFNDLRNFQQRYIELYSAETLEEAEQAWGAEHTLGHTFERCGGSIDIRAFEPAKFQDALKKRKLQTCDSVLLQSAIAWLSMLLDDYSAVEESRKFAEAIIANVKDEDRLRKLFDARTRVKFLRELAEIMERLQREARLALYDAVRSLAIQSEIDFRSMFTIVKIIYVQLKHASK